MVRTLVEQLIETTGSPTIAVHHSSGVYQVPRHWIALHGLKAWQLKELSEKYGWERREPTHARV